MKAAPFVVLVAGASFASAEPIVPQFDNLHVGIACADYWADPDHGLSVRIDGVLQEPRGEDGAPGWLRSNLGFLVPPGVHELAIEAPDCAPYVQQIVFGPFTPVFVSGRLLPTDGALRTPTGAPDGFGLLIGAYDQARGAHTGTDAVFAGQFAYDTASAYGLWLSSSYERRGFAVAVDSLIGGGPLDGTATGANGSTNFHGYTIHLGGALRVGGRLSLGSVELAAGAGIGGSLWVEEGGVRSMATGPNQADGDWYIPLWSALTYKPSCDLGVQVLAQYQLHPTASVEDAPTIAAGLLVQPTSACSERIGVAVRG
jgi:hypothetical protein